MKCSVNGCNLQGLENHHVTYIPEVIKPLCSEHHRKITAINSHEVRKKHNRNKYKGYFGEVKISNKQRWFLWYKFINNEIKTRISFLDKIFIEEGNSKYSLIDIVNMKRRNEEKKEEKKDLNEKTKE